MALLIPLVNTNALSWILRLASSFDGHLVYLVDRQLTCVSLCSRLLWRNTLWLGWLGVPMESNGSCLGYPKVKTYGVTHSGHYHSY